MTKTVDQLKEEQRDLIRCVEQTFTKSVHGQVVLNYLVETFYDCNLMGSSDAQTNRNIGQRDVVLHLKELIKAGEL